MSDANQFDGERFYCPKCQLWFPAEVIRDYMHSVVLIASDNTRHVVLPEPEALAMLRERGSTGVKH